MNGAIGLFGGSFNSTLDLSRELMGEWFWFWAAVGFVVTFLTVATVARQQFGNILLTVFCFALFAVAMAAIAFFTLILAMGD